MTFKKILLCLVCMFICIISLVTTTQVRALDNQATPYANIERYPAVGKKITGDSVKVSFNVREMTSGTMWSYDCRIRI